MSTEIPTTMARVAPNLPLDKSDPDNHPIEEKKLAPEEARPDPIIAANVYADSQALMEAIHSQLPSRKLALSEAKLSIDNLTPKMFSSAASLVSKVAFGLVVEPGIRDTIERASGLAQRAASLFPENEHYQQQWAICAFELGLCFPEQHRNRLEQIKIACANKLGSKLEYLQMAIDETYKKDAKDVASLETFLEQSVAVLMRDNAAEDRLEQNQLQQFIKILKTLEQHGHHEIAFKYWQILRDKKEQLLSNHQVYNHYGSQLATKCERPSLAALYSRAAARAISLPEYQGPFAAPVQDMKATFPVLDQQRLVNAALVKQKTEAEKTKQLLNEKFPDVLTKMVLEYTYDSASPEEDESFATIRKDLIADLEKLARNKIVAFVRNIYRSSGLDAINFDTRSIPYSLSEPAELGRYLMNFCQLASPIDIYGILQVSKIKLATVQTDDARQLLALINSSLEKMQEYAPAQSQDVEARDEDGIESSAQDEKESKTERKGGPSAPDFDDEEDSNRRFTDEEAREISLQFAGILKPGGPAFFTQPATNTLTSTSSRAAYLPDAKLPVPSSNNNPMGDEEPSSDEEQEEDDPFAALAERAARRAAAEGLSQQQAEADGQGQGSAPKNTL